MYSTNAIALDYDALVLNADAVLDYVFRRADSFSIVTDLIKPYSALQAGQMDCGAATIPDLANRRRKGMAGHHNRKLPQGSVGL